MGGIRIDPRTRIARTEAGVAWLDIAKAAVRHGLATLADSPPDAGVTGYTLGDKISFLGRTFGLTANSVTAIGHRRRAPGAGRSRAPARPVTEAHAGALWYPIERGSEVLHAWATLTRGVAAIGPDPF